MKSKFRYIKCFFDLQAWIAGIISFIFSMVISDWLTRNYDIYFTIENEQYLQWTLFIVTIMLMNRTINKIKRVIL